jgi:ferrous iron transport protein B
MTRHRVALLGNPNTGKTSVWNGLTGSHAKVGNYPGVTVERRVGELRGHRDVDLVDVPGAYSLVARSADEQIALEVVLGLADDPRPDLVVVCVDATQLVRSLYVVLQLQEFGVPCVVALTMTDEAGAASPDPSTLGRELGCVVIPVVGRTGVGLDALRAAITTALAAGGSATPVWRWQPSTGLSAHIASVRAALPTTWPNSDALALWALQCVGDDELARVPAAVRAAVIATNPDATIDDEAVLGRYRWLDRSVAHLMKQQVDRRRTQRIDRVLLHRGFGLLFFAGVMFVLFMSLFAWSGPAINLVERAFAALGDGVRAVLPDGVLEDFLVDGVIGGVGSVLVFLPQILLLFFLLGLLEDFGYLARVAYLMDRIMRSMNLHGRAFVPMLSGFACAVPAVMATRTMERQRDRILTMLVIPLMTCSARLPVYTLVIAALFPHHTWAGLSTQSLLMVAMYGFSILTALAAAWVLARVVKPLKAKRLPFVIELPPYRAPRLADVARMMWSKTASFLREAGTMILACTIALWALLYFPRQLPTGSPDYAAQIERAPTADAKAEIAKAQSTDRLNHSYGARLGHAIEPAIKPLGFDWKIGVGIIGAFAAREVFVSTLGVIFGVGDDEGTLRERLANERKPDGTRAYTPLAGLSLMIFFALACQCMSTLAVIKRETGGYRWPVFLFGYMTALAWLMSFFVYQGGRLLGF